MVDVRAVRVLSWMLVVAVLLPTLPSYAQEGFMGLGDLPGGNFLSVAAAVSSDGEVVVGYSDSGHRGREAFRWTREAGMVGLGDIEGGIFRSYAENVSGDGSFVVGAGQNDERNQPGKAFLWTAEGGMQDLGGIAPYPGGGSYESSALDVSDDGAVVVGSGRIPSAPSTQSIRVQAFRWTEAGGMVGLGELAGGSHLFSIAEAVSGDGSVIVGGSSSENGNQAFRWTEGTGMVGLGWLADSASTQSNATAISRDGRVITGWATGERIRREAFRWTAETGMVGLGLDLDSSCIYPRSISADGSIIVGTCTNSAYGAWVWSEATGMQLLTDYLSNAGLDFTGWTRLIWPEISDDGKAIIGFGRNPDNLQEAWIAVVPEPEQPTIEVDIDIIPNNVDPLNSTPEGEIPVAVLGSDTFDVPSIDLTTLEFGPNNVPPIHEGGHIEDVNDDGFPDLVLHYHTDDAEIVDEGLGATEACVRGRRTDGRRFEGCDYISITPTSFLQTDNVAVDPVVVAAVGDFDGDGDPDVVAALQAEGLVYRDHGRCGGPHGYRLNDVVWYENVNGRGLFGPAQPLLSEAGEVTVVELADIDGDTDLDLILGTTVDDALLWYPNADGRGNLAPGREITIGLDPPRVVEFGDFDGDGDLDVAWSGQRYRECLHDDGSVGWFENTNGQGDFSEEIRLRHYGTYLLDVADFENDGDDDLMIPGHFGPELLNIIDTTQFIVTDFRGWNICDWPYLVDVDLDLDIDLVCPGPWFENVGSVDGRMEVDVTAYGGMFHRSELTTTFDADLDGDIDYVHSYVGPLGLPPDYRDRPSAVISISEKRFGGNWVDQLTSGSSERLAYFIDPVYLHPDDPGGPDSSFYYDRVITQSFAVDVDMDTDIDLILVGPEVNRIYWFENSLLTPEPTAAELAEIQLQRARDIAANLSFQRFTASYKQFYFIVNLDKIIDSVREPNYRKARRDLRRLVALTDGCAATGTPDGEGPSVDWITDCEAQEPVYEALEQARIALTHESLQPTAK